MSCISKDFNFIHGDSHTEYFSIPMITGIAYSQIKLYYTIKTQQNGKPLLQKTIGNGIELLSADQENKVYHFMLTFTNGCTDCLKSNVEYLHDIEIKYGTYKQTLLKGNLKLDEEVTTTQCEC